MRRIITGLIISTLAYAAHASTIQHAFLVQNSGWMEPFYADPQSQYKALISAVIQTVSRPDEKIFVSSFNQAAGENKSPTLLHEGAGGVAPTEKLNQVTVARKNASGALADTDFQEAIGHVIRNQFSAKPGILWIFTNNKNSPNNDPQTAQRNRDFYKLVHLEPAISRTVVFPLKMSLRGKLYSANGMMVYALAYGDQASRHLLNLIESGQLGKVFTNPPARLKPIDQDAVRLIPKRVENTQNVVVSLAPDQRTLLVDIEASSTLPQVNIKATFQNMFYPYVITSANASAAVVGDWGKVPVEILPTSFAGVLPAQEREVAVTLPIPVAQIPSPWSPVALAAMGKQVQIPAVLEISLTEQKLQVSDAFKRSLSELFPGDPLSEMFVPPESVRSSSVALPMLVRIQYPLLPLFLVLGAVLLAVAGGSWLMVLASRTPRYSILVDGSKRTVAVKAFSTSEVRASDGAVAGLIKRGIGKPRVIRVDDGHTVAIP